MAITADQRRAFEILTGSLHGVTESVMLAHGFTVRLLTGLVRAGLAVAAPESVKAGGKTLSVVRVTITDAGRWALSGE
jgi:hypothetical protein